MKHPARTGTALACAAAAASLALAVPTSAVGHPGSGAAAPALAAAATATTSAAVRVKLAEGAGVRLRSGRLVAAAGSSTEGTGAVDAELARSGATGLQPVFSDSHPATQQDQERLQRVAGEEPPDLGSWVQVSVPAGRAQALAGDLKRLPGVQAAFVVASAPPPPSADYRGRQVYAGASPYGMGVLGSDAAPGGNGDHVQVFDLEYGWNRDHEDLSKLRLPGASIPNGTPVDPYGTDHGTAVAGILGADDNGFGVTGLVPGAQLHTVNTTNAETGWNLANAVDTARRHMGAGDVMLIEQQTTGATAQDLVPVEDAPDVYDAIRTATADGVIVVEPGGNGGVDLDSPAYSALFGPQGRPSSGALVVGAGSEGNFPGSTCGDGVPEHSRLGMSDYGSRVDVQGWGDCVTTTGYGDLTPGPHNGSDPDTWYTAYFNGTSSASATIAGAAASLSSAFEAQLGHPPTVAQVRDLLVRTGSPQDSTSPGAATGHIGPLPDLEAAFRAAGLRYGATATVPSAPSGVSAVAGDATARVSWSGPIAGGGSAVTSSTVTASPGGRRVQVAGSTRSARFRGLTNGTAYTFTVTARNSSGTSAASAPSAPVTPTRAPR